MENFLYFYLIAGALTTLISLLALWKDRHEFKLWRILVAFLGLIWPITWIWVARNIIIKRKADRQRTPEKSV